MQLDCKKYQGWLNEQVGRIKYLYDQSLTPSPVNGMLCIDFVRYAYQQIGVELPESLYDAEKLFNKFDVPRVGDIAVVYDTFAGERHVGIVVDPLLPVIVSCSGPTNGVGRTDLSRGNYRMMTRYYMRLKDLDLA